MYHDVQQRICLVVVDPWFKPPRVRGIGFCTKLACD